MSKPKQWKCEVCGYIHEGSAPPAECPICGVGPEQFTLVEEAPTTAAPSPASEATASANAPNANSQWRCGVCGAEHHGATPPPRCPSCGALPGLFALTQNGPRLVQQGPSLVIVGGGVAALAAAEAARQASPELRITLIHKEPEPPYNRLNLTRLLDGQVDQAGLPLRPAGFYADARIALVHDEVTRIDRVAQKVELQGRGAVDYDRLILANGAHAFVPPVPGIGRTGVLPLRTLAHAREILLHAKSGRPAVVLGGGLLGLEAAVALARRGVKVTVLEGFGWLLPRQLAEPAGQMLQRYLEKLGVQVRCNAQTKEVLGDEAVRAVLLADGTELSADLLLVATGVRPNSHLARACGLEVKQGVVVDDLLCTSDPNIWAAGDVAQHRGVVYGLWPAAMSQGKLAGHNAAGGVGLEFAGMAPAAQLKVVDVAVFAIGVIAPTDASYRVIERTEAEAYYRFVTRDGALVGANLFGDTRLAARLKSAVDHEEQISAVAELKERFGALHA